jgi:hypothetical protein
MYFFSRKCSPATRQYPETVKPTYNSHTLPLYDQTAFGPSTSACSYLCSLREFNWQKNRINKENTLNASKELHADVNADKTKGKNTNTAERGGAERPAA